MIQTGPMAEPGDVTIIVPSRPAAEPATEPGLTARVADLEARVAALETALRRGYVTLEPVVLDRRPSAPAE